MILIDGKKEAALLREELKKEVSDLKNKYNKIPGLTVILIGDLTPSQIYVKNKDAGLEWVKYWNSLLYGGVLPHALKELCRIYISIDHECGYCSTVRSTKGAAEGVTEEKVAALMHFEASDLFSEKEKIVCIHENLLY